MARQARKGEVHRKAAGDSARPDTQSRVGKLPQLLQEIADVTDIGTALAVARAKGGQHANFTRKPRPDNWLARAVGLQRAIAIGEALVGATGGRLLVPMGPEAFNARRARIEALTLEGRSTAEVARAVGLATRTITYHRSRMRAEGLMTAAPAKRPGRGHA
jgi:DNA-binding CsgD family transcriptional regulator